MTKLPCTLLRLTLRKAHHSGVLGKNSVCLITILCFSVGPLFLVWILRVIVNYITLLFQLWLRYVQRTCLRVKHHRFFIGRGSYCIGASPASRGMGQWSWTRLSNPINFVRDFPGCPHCILAKNTRSSFTSPFPIPDQIGSLFFVYD